MKNNYVTCLDWTVCPNMQRSKLDLIESKEGRFRICYTSIVWDLNDPVYEKTPTWFDDKVFDSYKDAEKHYIEQSKLLA